MKDEPTKSYFLEKEEDYNLTPTRLYTIIDSNFSAAKRLKISRLSVQWGVWSGAMNRMVRKLGAESLNHTKDEYENVFIYWQMKSQLLEFHYKSWMGIKFLWDSKIKRQQRLIKKWKKERKIL